MSIKIIKDKDLLSSIKRTALDMLLSKGIILRCQAAISLLLLYKYHNIRTPWSQYALEVLHLNDSRPDTTTACLYWIWKDILTEAQIDDLERNNIEENEVKPIIEDILLYVYKQIQLTIA